MIRQKLLWTLLLEVVYVVAAVTGDFVFNVLIFRTPSNFTPATTAMITLLVGAPITYYLLSQRFDLRKVISDRERLERELTGALSEAEAGARAKSEFLANMTHELRTPLNAIIGFSGLLKDSTDLNARDARQVGLVWNASQTLLHVVNDVLDFSKLEAGAIEFDLHPFNPFQTAESAAALLVDQAAAKGLTLSVSHDGLTDCLLGDTHRFRQVLLNFISNAIKFTPAGEIEVRVSQTADGAERRLRMEVVDSGIGVPPDQLETIFGRFTQADSSVSRQYGGTGLGLAISKRIIETLGGDIGATSQAGRGSTFWFEVSLPIAELGETRETVAGAAVQVESDLRLLLVEDNAVNRELIGALLAPFEITIEAACDGVEAVEAAARGVFDIILMDVQMPNMDGLTATRRIRAAAAAGTRRVPIIAMTANVMPEQILRCREAGMDDHVGKPINPATLLEAIGRWSAAESTAVEASATQAR